jgi:hypothetical protein
MYLQLWWLHCVRQTHLPNMSDKRRSPTAAYSSSSIGAFKSPTQTHLNHFVWEQNDCLCYEKHVHVECDESILRVRNCVPSITGQNLDLKGTCRGEHGGRSAQWRRHIRQHRDVSSTHKCSTDRHLMSLFPTASSFFPYSSFFTSSSFSQTGSACAYLKIISRIPTFALQVTIPSCLQPFCLHVLSIPTRM